MRIRYGVKIMKATHVQIPSRVNMDLATKISSCDMIGGCAAVTLSSITATLEQCLAIKP